MSKRFLQLKKHLMKAHHVKDRQKSKSSAMVFFVNCSLVLTLAVVGIGYLVAINSLATKGYTIKFLQSQIAVEKRQNQQLQLKGIEAGSLGSVQERIAALQLVRSERIEYLNNSSVAQR